MNPFWLITSAFTLITTALILWAAIAKVLEMTRPLTVFLQLVGVIIFVVGVASNINIALIVIGLSLLIIGGIGHRSRAKKS